MFIWKYVHSIISYEITLETECLTIIVWLNGYICKMGTLYGQICLPHFYECKKNQVYKVAYTPWFHFLLKQKR